MLVVGEAGERSAGIFVDWKESGIEIANAAGPRGAGSGRRLIEDALPYQFGERTTFAMNRDGVCCTVALPRASPQTEEEFDGKLGAS
jgi:hypothetical protein